MTAPERPALLLWDDELGPEITHSDRFRIVHRPHADGWREDLAREIPFLALLDNDMGRRHLQGWQVLAELRHHLPSLVVFGISRNLAATIRMVRDGALPVEKDRLRELLCELHVAWDDLLDATGCPSRARCTQLACVNQILLSFGSSLQFGPDSHQAKGDLRHMAQLRKGL